MHQLSGPIPHIPDVMAPGWAEFHRDLYTEFQRAGLIADFRECRRGGTSQLVIEKLARRIIGWYLSRHDEEPTNWSTGPR